MYVRLYTLLPFKTLRSVKFLFFIKELNTFIFSKDVIKVIKIFTVKTFIMLQNVISNKEKNDNFHRNITVFLTC